MREAVREILGDLPQAILTAAGVMIFLACVIGVLIVAATPIPEVLQ